MSLLVVYGEEKVKIDENGNKYNSGAYSPDMWQQCYKKLDHDITFVSRVDSTVYSQVEAEKRFNEFPKDVSFFALEDYTQSIYNFFSPRIKKKIKKEIEEKVLENEHVIARFPSRYSYYAIDSAKKHRIPYVVEVVGCSWDSMWNYGFVGKLLAFPSYVSLKNNIKKCKNVVYVTKSFLQKRYPTKGNSIFCSDVCLDPVDGLVLEHRKMKIQSMKQKVVLGTCGAIDIKYKGHRHVLKAMSRLKDFPIQIEYQIVGGGKTDAICRIAEKYGVLEQVKILGMLPHERVFKWLDDEIDIYIQPSDTEGFSRALLEAISRGCPCIASNVGGNPEMIDSAYLFNKANAIELADLIKRCALNKQELLKMSESNFVYSEPFSKVHLFDKRLSFYKECLE